MKKWVIVLAATAMAAFFYGQALAFGLGEVKKGFSADHYAWGGGRGKQKNKVYAEPGRLRLERSGDVVIFRQDKNLAWVLDPVKKTYLELKLNEKSAEIPFALFRSPQSRRSLGREKANGFNCLKERVSFSTGTSGPDALSQLASEIDPALGRLLSLQTTGSLKGVIWTAESLGIPIKAATDNGIGEEFQNIQPGAQSDRRFRIPRGYRAEGETGQGAEPLGLQADQGGQDYDPGTPLKAKGVTVINGRVRNPERMIDHALPPEGANWNDRGCVSWRNSQASFVIDLGRRCMIENLTLSLDHNDNYTFDVSLDGKKYRRLFIATPSLGEISDGMETLSTDPRSPEYESRLGFKKTEARYIKVTAGGRGKMAVGEVMAYGRSLEDAGQHQPGEEAYDPGPPLSPKSIAVAGGRVNNPERMIDQRIPPEGTPWNDRSCVTWSGQRISFVIDLGGERMIENLNLSLDCDDNYEIRYSLDGRRFRRLLVINPSRGEIKSGMDLMSTDPKHPEYDKGLSFQPVKARYLMLTGFGDKLSAGEIQAYGRDLENAPPDQPEPGPAAGSDLLTLKPVEPTGTMLDGRTADYPVFAGLKDGNRVFAVDVVGLKFIDPVNGLVYPVDQSQASGRRSIRLDLAGVNPFPKQECEASLFLSNGVYKIDAQWYGRTVSFTLPAGGF